MSSWQLVMYGRTRRADRWWRVRPRSVDLDWLNPLVTATTAGGIDLEHGPRFVLARHDGATLVGGSSRAASLSESMNNDGSRPLYVFVGWLTSHDEPLVPSLEQVESEWVEWASAEYQSWMPLDWNRHPTDVGEPHEPPLWPARWTAPATPDQPDPQPPARTGPPRPSHPGRLTVPFEQRHATWRELAAGRQDIGYVACLSYLAASTAEGLTHVALYDNAGAAATTDVDLDGSEAPAAEPKSVPEPAPVPLPESNPPPDPSSPEPPAPPVEPPAPPDSHEDGAGGRLLGKVKRLAGRKQSDGPTDDRHRPDPPRTAGGPTGDLGYWRDQERRRPE